jgi:hypothetical protein
MGGTPIEEDAMSKLIISGVLTVAISVSTAAFAAGPIIRGVHHGRLLPSAGVGISNNQLMDNGGRYWQGEAGTGQLAPMGSGLLDSMRNDFGTSGTLGHSNGMPVTGH